jgi:septal ring factor EnvC (AmiA/AmiB activator)
MNELFMTKVIEKLKAQVAELAGSLAEAQAKSDLFRESLQAHEQEIAEIKAELEEFKKDDANMQDSAIENEVI